MQFNLEETAARALESLAADGTSEKTLKGYRNTGFGCAIRYFRANGVAQVDDTMLDTFVQEQRALFEEGGISQWKWSLLRRGCEILKHYAKTGSTELPPLQPWDLPVRQKTHQHVGPEPAPEQLADPEDIFALVWKTNQALQKSGLSPKTVGHYTNGGLHVIMRHHFDEGVPHYSVEIIYTLVTEMRAKYDQGIISRTAYQNVRKAAYLLEEMHDTGHITLTKLPDWGQREPTDNFQKLLRHFCETAERNGAHPKGSVRTAKSAIRTFLFCLEDSGHKDFDGIALRDISDCVSQFAERYTNGLTSAIYCVRKFLKHLYEFNFTQEDLSKAIPEFVPTRKKFREGFSDFEIEQLLSAPDRNTPLGKRNYAIMLLASQTGLRACDIVNLKRSNIDWRAMEIRITQLKTGVPITVPLMIESGNAVADYLLNARPKSDLPYIFLCHSGPMRPVDSRSASAIVTKYISRCGLGTDIRWRGFHSFRRSLGTSLLQSEAPLELIQQLLGHSHMDSVRPYLSVNEMGLKDCALRLLSHGKEGEQ